MAQKRMKGLTLSSFKTTSTPEAKPEPPLEKESAVEPAKASEKTRPKRKTKKKAEKLATLNIQVTRSQQRWLQDMAQDIRDNNETPVPGPERVYPVHLIQVAIDLLKMQSVEWGKVTDIEGLRDQLNL